MKVKPRAGTCWVVLSRVRSPGNFGSLIRTSGAVGGAGFILVGGAVDPFDPAVVRASMGSIFSQTLVRTGSRQLRHWVRRHQLQVVGASPDAELAYDELAYRRPPLFVLGEERRGLDSEQRNLCDALVRIPCSPAPTRSTLPSRGASSCTNPSAPPAVGSYPALNRRIHEDRPPIDASIGSLTSELQRYAGA